MRIRIRTSTLGAQITKLNFLQNLAEMGNLLFLQKLTAVQSLDLQTQCFLFKVGLQLLSNYDCSILAIFFYENPHFTMENLEFWRRAEGSIFWTKVSKGAPLDRNSSKKSFGVRVRSGVLTLCETETKAH